MQPQPPGAPLGPEIKFPWMNEKDEKPWGIYTDEKTGAVIMVDSIEMDLVQDSIKIEDGIMTGDAIMTAAMVQDYKGKKVLKCPDELKKACDIYIVPMPCTHRHPVEGIVMSQDEIVGWTMTPPLWDATNLNVRTSVRITDKDTIKSIEDGKTDVSIGFFCDLESKKGTYKGESHDAIQRNIVFNHLAVGLDKGNGRCPDGTCGIKAGDTVAENEMQITPAMRQKGTESLKLIKIGMKSLLESHKGSISPEVEKWIEETEQKFAMPKNADEKKKNDSYEKGKEGTPMTEEKNKTDTNVPEPKAPEVDKATPPAGEPQKTEASTYVDEMIADERKKLVDAIMDAKPPRDRAHYDAKPMAELRDLTEFLRTVNVDTQIIQSGPAPTGDARAMIDDAYGKVEKELHSRK